MTLAHPLHPRRSRSRNKRRNQPVGWMCVLLATLFLVWILNFIHIHNMYYSCILSNSNKLFQIDSNFIIPDSLYYNMYIGTLLHHILWLIAYTFRENRDFVLIIIVQFMMSANIRIRFGLQIAFICLYITPSHYHHCAKLIWGHWTYKMPVRYILSSVWVKLSIFSQFTHFPCDDWENIHFVLLSSSNRKDELLSIV